jgi:glucose/arabinose dehydrogenase
MAFLPASAAGAPVAWRGSLFIAAPDEQCVLRVSGLSDSPPAPAVERLFQGEFGRITLVRAAEDGLYFATSNGAAGGDARAVDAVYRVRERTTSGFVARSRGWIQPPSAGHDTVSVSLPRRRESP